jgi:DNA-binding HxlR family transcriptional regulator
MAAKKAPKSALDEEPSMSDSIYDVLNPKCPTQQVLDRIASKWAMLVILALSEQPLRDAQLQRRVAGVTKKMLTQTLRALERDGLVRRRVYGTVPVQTEYALSALGRGLARTVVTLRTWAYANVEDIAQARTEYDAVVRGERCVPSRADAGGAGTEVWAATQYYPTGTGQGSTYSKRRRAAILAKSRTFLVTSTMPDSRQDIAKSTSFTKLRETDCQSLLSTSSASTRPDSFHTS